MPFCKSRQQRRRAKQGRPRVPGGSPRAMVNWPPAFQTLSFSQGGKQPILRPGFFINFHSVELCTRSTEELKRTGVRGRAWKPDMSTFFCVFRALLRAPRRVCTRNKSKNPMCQTGFHHHRLSMVNRAKVYQFLSDFNECYWFGKVFWRAFDWYDCFVAAKFFKSFILGVKKKTGSGTGF